MNKITLLLGVIVALFQGCGPADPNKVVVNGSFEVEPGKFMFHKVTLEGMGNFTLTVAPQGGDVEAWLAPGDARPLVVYNPNEPLPQAKLFAAGKEDSATGSYAWGGHHVVVFNRGPAAIKVRCKLIVVENPKKA